MAVQGYVPSDPIARLMYYFDCVCACVEFDDNQVIRRFKDYQNYPQLTWDEQAQLIDLCLSLSPDKLRGIIFHPVERCGNMSNKFVELSTIRTNLVARDHFDFEKQKRRIIMVMFFTNDWMEKYFVGPMKEIKWRRRPRPNPSCVIL